MKGVSRKSFILLICVSLILDWNVVLAAAKEKKCKVNAVCCAAIVGVLAGGVGVLAGGIGACGIAAGACAPWLMSTFASAAGVPAGGLAGGLVTLLASCCCLTQTEDKE